MSSGTRSKSKQSSTAKGVPANPSTPKSTLSKKPAKPATKAAPAKQRTAPVPSKDPEPTAEEIKAFRALLAKQKQLEAVAKAKQDEGQHELFDTSV